MTHGDPVGSQERWVLAASARILDTRDALTVLGAIGDAREFLGSSAGFARAVLGMLRAPTSRVELLADLAARADDDVDPKIVDDLLGILESIGAIERVGDPPARAAAPRRAATRPRRIVLGVSGAIQAVEVPRLVFELHARGFEVRVAVTDTARRFVSTDALDALTHARTVSSLWPAADSAHGSADDELRVPHIDLARWADLVLVYPASATTISRIATGDCSDVVAAIAIATRAPVVLAPSMNDAMLTSGPVERNLEALIEDGFTVLWPSLGVEVADAPGRRPRRFGPAIKPERLVPLLELVLQRAGASVAPIDWDSMFLSGEPLPWETDVDDAPLDAVLARFPPPRALLDVGTGTGARAIAWAERGYRVVATDVSPAALDRARVRDGAAEVLFVHDDIRETRLRARFDVIVDRGCFHSLDPLDGPRCRAAVDALLAPGGALLVLHDGPRASTDRRTRRIAPDALAAELGLTVESTVDATLVADEPGLALLTTLRR